MLLFLIKRLSIKNLNVTLSGHTVILKTFFFYRLVYKLDVYTSTTADNYVKAAGYPCIITQSYLASTALQTLAKYTLTYRNQMYMLRKSSILLLLEA